MRVRMAECDHDRRKKALEKEEGYQNVSSSVTVTNAILYYVRLVCKGHICKGLLDRPFRTRIHASTHSQTRTSFLIDGRNGVIDLFPFSASSFRYYPYVSIESACIDMPLKLIFTV